RGARDASSYPATARLGGLGLLGRLGLWGFLGGPGGQFGGEFVECGARGVPLLGAERVGGEAGLVEQRRQAARRAATDDAGGDRPGEQLIGGVSRAAGGAPVGEAAFHRDVAGDDRGAGV